MKSLYKLNGEGENFCILEREHIELSKTWFKVIHVCKEYRNMFLGRKVGEVVWLCNHSLLEFKNKGLFIEITEEEAMLIIL